MKDKAGINQADNRHNKGSHYHRYLKRAKVRLERRRAKRNPQCLSAYRKYDGYET